MPSLGDLAARFGGTVAGNPAVVIDGVGSLTGAGARQLAFYESDKHRHTLLATTAGAVLMPAGISESAPCPQWQVTGAPRLYFARAAQWLAETSAPSALVSAQAFVAESAVIGNNTTIAPGAVVEEEAHIGDNCRIGAGAVVGAKARIGAGSVLMAQATIYAGVVLGEYCIIHSGAVIGADGFGYVRDDDGAQVKIPQLGGVRLGARVEVGANSAIDRGALDDTIIGDGVKIDNLVQIGHNVHIGDNTVVCGCVGIAGSTHIGKGCMLGGGAGIAGHLTVGDGAMVAARAAVTRPVAAGEAVSSIFPAMPVGKWRRFAGGLRRLVSQQEGGHHERKNKK